MNSEWLAAILGGGGVAFITAVFKGLQALLQGARGSQREAIHDLEQWRRDADRDRRRAHADADYQRKLVAWWQTRAGTLEYVMSQNGCPVPPITTPIPAPPDFDSEPPEGDV